MKSRSIAGLLLAAVFACSTAGAQTFGTGRAIDVQLFRPANGPMDLITIESARLFDKGKFGLGFYYNYQRDPLVLRAGERVVERVVSDQQTLNLLFSISPVSFLQLGIDIPIHVRMDGGGGALLIPGATLSAHSFGDIRLNMKWRLAGSGRDGFGMAVSTPLTLPSGNDGSFAGEANVNFAPRIIFDYIWGRLMIAGHIGYLFREQVRFGDLSFDDEFQYGLGFSLALWREKVGTLERDRITLLGEYNGRSSAVVPFQGVNDNPMELLAAVRFGFPSTDLALTVGAGLGVHAGYGSPRGRFFLGLQWAPTEAPPPPPKDTDKDGILDKDDRCPTTPGPKENGGCPWPDSDGDGILDKDDGCPRTPGPKANRGCPWPDSDGDGILDKDDKCPDKPGPKANGGCPWPDTDKDGILDKDDKCPKVPGPRENGGCPWPDTDGDGILDKDDKCPKVAGPKENGGCPWPDTDGDGVLDKDDDCPRQPGPASNKGCPKKKVIVTRREVKILDQVNFRTGSARILRKSFGLLDEVAATLLKYKFVKLVEVQGHTDDVGSTRSNQRLSERRAASVVRYLVKKGVAPSRLQAKGYGEGKPLVPVAKGMSRAEKKKVRAKNRRVQFVILKQ